MLETNPAMPRERLKQLEAGDGLGIARSLYLSEVDKARSIAAALPLDREAALFILATARELFLASFAQLHEPLQKDADGDKLA